MRFLIATTLLLWSLALFGCSSPTPTPTPTPTATPTPTPTPSPLDRAMAVAETIKQTLARIESVEDLTGLAGTASAEMVELLCEIAAGEYEPHLALDDLTDSRTVQLGIRGFCASL